MLTLEMDPNWNLKGQYPPSLCILRGYEFRVHNGFVDD
jgi:hypothetical protein